MTLDDLQTLEIGLELYRRESPLDGECERILAFLLRVVRDDIVRVKRGAPSSGGLPRPGQNPFNEYPNK